MVRSSGKSVRPVRLCSIPPFSGLWSLRFTVAMFAGYSSVALLFITITPGAFEAPHVGDEFMIVPDCGYFVPVRYVE